MANEATVNSGLSIRKSDGTTILLDYSARPSSFRVTVTGTKGPTPGALTIPVGGKIISLVELSTPGLCRIMNCNADNFVEFGIYDDALDTFIPFLEVGPGETYVFKFTRNILERYSGGAFGTGTGTTSTANRYFFAKANTGECVCIIEAFEK